MGTYRKVYDHRGAWIAGPAGRIRAPANPAEADQFLAYVRRVQSHARRDGARRARKALGGE